jgi:hypothetical protein
MSAKQLQHCMRPSKAMKGLVVDDADLIGFPRNRFNMDLYYDGECFIYTDGDIKIHRPSKLQNENQSRTGGPSELHYSHQSERPSRVHASEVSENIKSWPHVTSCNRVKETKRQGRIAHHLYRFCPTAMPPFRTSWLYLVSPFTLQRYELLPFLPNKSRFILSFFLKSSLFSKIFPIFAQFNNKCRRYGI